MSDSRPGIRLSGFGLAFLAFFLTRFLVAGATRAEVDTFVFAILVPLVAGLGLTIYGVAIGVGAVSHDYAHTVWRWSVLGTFTMVLVLATASLNTVLQGEPLDQLWEQSGIVIANVFLGGAILGAIVGHRTARSRRKNEELVQYAERAMLVNRRLRHEILNVAAIVKGYAHGIEDDEIEDASTAIRESTEQIERTVDHVNEFAGTTGEVAPTDLGDAVERTLELFPDDVEVTVAGSIPDDTLVRADDRLELLVAELVENAIEHAGPNPDVAIELTPNGRTVELTVRDDGPGLPETAKEVLAARSLPEYDDPSFGYGLQMVRLLVEQYDGAIAATSDGGASVTVTLQRTRERSTPALALGVPVVDLLRVSVAALVAGFAMGLLMDHIAGIMPTLGAMYGVEHGLVGWVAHLFHSILFALLFAAGCTVAPLDDVASTVRGSTALGLGWGLVLWLVGAGIVMPVWMMAVNLDATIPNLTVITLVSHVVWGLLLGALYPMLPDNGDFVPDVGGILRNLVPTR
ncbi:sensor histidine kinase [Salinarchaeum laminariae]|uniref:sensor histidine kinase n=1 Tax=Salinarchaeum laminariae TaxID=869888 RepID=UPI0020BD99B5|nr:sensor histidine kinase [Salinarchaeum laminariae]